MLDKDFGIFSTLLPSLLIEGIITLVKLVQVLEIDLALVLAMALISQLLFHGLVVDLLGAQLEFMKVFCL